MNNERLKVYREMLSELKDERERIDWQIAWLEQKVLSDSRRIALMATSDENPKSPPEKRIYKKNPATKKSSILDLAAQVLGNAGSPLHGTILVEGLHARGSQTTMRSVTNRMPKDDRFENLGQNTWALKKWPDELKEKYRNKTRHHNAK